MNKKEDEKSKKEVVRFEKSIYPDLITGYPIKYYDRFKYMTDTLMWFNSCIVVNLNIYGSRQTGVSTRNLELHPFYNVYEGDKGGGYNSIQRSFIASVAIETSKRFNMENLNSYDGIKYNFNASNLAMFKYTEVEKIISWYTNPSKYLESYKKEVKHKPGTFASVWKAGTKDLRVAKLIDKDGGVITFEAVINKNEEGGANGIEINMRISNNISVFPISWPTMFQFIHSVIELNLNLYASSMLSFMGMPPVGVGMNADQMAKYDGLKHYKTKTLSYFSRENNKSKTSQAIDKANKVAANIQENNFRKEYGLDE